MNPKYSVGEVIILKSVTYPEYNGEYTIIQILPDFEDHKCRITGESSRCAGGPGNISYILNQPHLSKKTGVEVFWSETALRKKHEPSRMSFQSLIQSVNSPVKQES